MYTVKVVRVDGSSRLVPCESVESKTVHPESFAARERLASEGLSVQLSPSGEVIQLPGDGVEAVYVMNEQGVTVDIHRWPPKNRNGN